MRALPDWAVRSLVRDRMPERPGNVHPDRPGYFRVDVTGLDAGAKFKAKLNCGCIFPLTVPQPANCLVFTVRHDSAKGCSARRRPSDPPPPVDVPSPVPPGGAPSLAPPLWWDGRTADQRFAEVLFLHHQQPGNICHYVFDTLELRERFPGIRCSQWFNAVPYLETVWSSPASVMRTHHADLRAKRKRMAQPPPVLSGIRKLRTRNAPDDERNDAASTNRRGARVTARGAWSGIVTDNEGNVL